MAKKHAVGKKASKQEVVAMFAAAVAGDSAKVVKLLRAGVPADVRNQWKATPLMEAAKHDHFEVFRILLEGGADLHATRSKDLGDSVLQQAVGKSATKLQMVQTILADGGIKLTDGLDTAFEMACQYGSLEMVAVLIEAGADVNHSSCLGDTPILFATDANRPEIVAKLLKAGANFDVRKPKLPFSDNKHWKKTAVEIALAEGYTEIIELLQTAGALVAAKLARKDRPKSAGPVTDSWKRIDMWLKNNASTWRPLKKGAGPKQIEQAEAKIGHSLPAEVRKSYQVHDGTKVGFFPSATDIADYYLMPLAEVAKDWKMMKELLDNGNFADATAKGAKGVQSDWWNTSWIPFASNGGGNYYCIDLAPDNGGKKGQIISMNHESGERDLLSPSFAGWLCAFANDLDDDKYRYNEDEGLV